MNGRRVIRGLAGLVAAAVLVLPGGVAVGVDDPGPVKWPTVAAPESGGAASDPKVQGWPKVRQPEAGTASDPKPVNWPAPDPPS